MSIPTNEDASEVEGAMKRRERTFAPKPVAPPTHEDSAVMKVCK